MLMGSCIRPSRVLTRVPGGWYLISVFESDASGVTRPNLSSVVAKEVRDLILAGRLRPGERIDQTTLADQFGVSRMPVREAIFQLEAEGLITGRARYGAYVTALTPQDFIDHYEALARVSGLAAARAASARSDEDVVDLQRVVTEMESEASPGGHHDLNDRFHRHINRIGSSARLKAVLKYFANSLPSRYFDEDSSPRWRSEAQAEHRRILDAIVARDSVAAEAAVQAHFRNSGEHAIQYLQTVGFWD